MNSWTLFFRFEMGISTKNEQGSPEKVKIDGSISADFQ